MDWNPIRAVAVILIEVVPRNTKEDLINRSERLCNHEGG